MQTQRVRTDALGRAGFRFDPARPIVQNWRNQQKQSNRDDKRLRTAHILAAIRQLSMECGIERVTVRDIAKHSGYSIQTLYNLLGSRDMAVDESVKEYYRFVASVQSVNVSTPGALFELVDRWINSIRDAPGYQWHIGRAFFNGDRKLFYSIRDYTVKQMAQMFRFQKETGTMCKSINEVRLAQELTWYSGSVILDWCDERITLDESHRKITECFKSITSNKYNTL